MALLKSNHIFARMKAPAWMRWLTRKAPNSDCAIVQLPHSVMLALAGSLPMHSQVLLAQTCSSLRLVFRCIYPTGWHLGPEETLELLTCLARDMPNRWVCEQCLKLHIRRQWDTPRAYACRSCPRGSMADVYRTRNISFAHHHIQLALKYARMRRISEAQHQYLDAVLASHWWSFDGPFYKKNGLATRSSLHSKIVRGRFLTKSIIHFDQCDKEVLLDNLRFWDICKHQYLLGWDSWWARQRPRHPSKPEHVLLSTVLAAFEAEGSAEFHASCPLCPTDFSFQVSAKRATLRVWTDLGPEGSHSDDLWKVRAGKDGIRGPGIPNEEPGRVQRLYQSERGRTARPKVVVPSQAEIHRRLLEASIAQCLICCT